MASPKATLGAIGVLVMSVLPLAPAQAAGPGYFVAGGAVAHAFFGLATLPLAIIGAAASAAASQGNPGYAPPVAYDAGRPVYGAPPTAYFPRADYAPSYYPPSYYPPSYYAPPVGYYGGARAYYYSGPRAYYGGQLTNYGGPRAYYGARAGYTAGPGYQAARRPSYYHYPR
jgi:hypothetical protein